MRTAPWHKRITRALTLCLGALLCCLAPAMAVAASTWNTTTVDNTATDTGKFASLAVDSSKFLHISYFDAAGSLKYATNKTGSWALTTLPGTGVAAAGTAIALDASNNPLVSYYYSGTGNKGSRFQAFSGGAWGAFVAVDTGSTTPTLNSSMAMQQVGGVANVLFSGKSNTLYHNSNTTAGNYVTWSTSAQLDTVAGSGFNSAVVVDAAGKVHSVGYNSISTDLFYYTNVSGAWAKSDLQVSTDDLGAYCSIAVGTVSNVETLLVTYLDKTHNNVMFTTKQAASGGSWSAPVVIGAAGSSVSFVGGYTAIAADSSGAAHVSFYYNNAGTGNLKYASNLGGSWIVETVDAANVGTYSSIGVDANQTVSIAYYDVTNTALKVATKAALLASPGSTDFGTVDPGSQSANHTITLTNNLMASQTIGAAPISGTNAADFALVTNSCSGLMLAPQGTCTITADFAPASGTPLARNATLTVSSTAPAVASQTVAFTGTATDKLIIHASAGSGGSISPSGYFTVARNGSQSFTVTPDSGYSVAGVTDNGNPMSAPYTISGITADHTVSASFTAILPMPFMILNSLTSYGTLQAAYDAATDNNTIESWLGTFATEYLTVGRNMTTTLRGGYDATFSSQTGSTTLHRILVSIPNTNPGKLIVEKIVLK